jgi:hypothetical protein
LHFEFPIGFDYRALNQKQQNKKTKFVPDAEAYDPTIGKPMLQHPKQHPSPKSKGRSRRWICHHCCRNVHIRTFCFKLYGYPKWYQQAKPEHPELEATHIKKEWKPKDESGTL